MLAEILPQHFILHTFYTVFEVDSGLSLSYYPATECPFLYQQDVSYETNHGYYGYGIEDAEQNTYMYECKN